MENNGYDTQDIFQYEEKEGDIFIIKDTLNNNTINVKIIGENNLYQIIPYIHIEGDDDVQEYESVIKAGEYEVKLGNHEIRYTDTSPGPLYWQCYLNGYLDFSVTYNYQELALRLMIIISDEGFKNDVLESNKNNIGPILLKNSLLKFFMVALNMLANDKPSSTTEKIEEKVYKLILVQL